MTRNTKSNERLHAGSAQLAALPIVPAYEFMVRSGIGDGSQVGGGSTEETSGLSATAFADEREYRFCKAVIDNPLRPSSQYPKLMQVSTKTALTLRQSLVARGYIRERKVELSGRGRSTILLESTPAGIKAVEDYEAKEE